MPRRKEEKENHFHRNCFACGSGSDIGLRLKFHRNADGSVWGDFLAHQKFEGYSGILHGGIIATLLDSAMTHCLLMENIPALTGRLSIKYSTPIRTGKAVKLEARIVDQFHEMYILEGKASVDGKKVASAEAKYRSTRGGVNQGAKKMTPFSSRVPSLEYKLIGDILREYPQMSEIMQKHFGRHCLEWEGFKIQSLGMACILFGVDQKRLLQEFEKIRP